MKILLKARLFTIALFILALVLGVSEIGIFMNSVAQASFMEEAWGQAGTVAYRAAANTMKSRNIGSQPLDDFQKRYLRRYFADLIDTVTITYGSEMMDRWIVSGSAIRLGEVESIAQTYCDRIYVRDPYYPEDRQQLIILAHEMMHVQQCQKLGGIDRFGYHYFREYKRANQSYVRNKLEQEAYVFQKKFAVTL